MPPTSSTQALMLQHQYADTDIVWERLRQRFLENCVHATKLRKLIERRTNEVHALAIATTDDRKTRVAFKNCAQEFKGLATKKTKWW
ncbi:hypothetical protein XPA_000029 [Xanthoria parietina]